MRDAESGIRRAAREARGIDAHRVLAEPGDVRSEAAHGFQERLDVTDAGQVVEDDRPGHEERCRDDREGLVLVPGRPDRALNRAPTFHRELVAGKRLDEYRHESMLLGEPAGGRQQLAVAGPVSARGRRVRLVRRAAFL